MHWRGVSQAGIAIEGVMTRKMGNRDSKRILNARANKSKNWWFR